MLSPRRAPIAQPANGRARRRSRTILAGGGGHRAAAGRSARPARRPRGARPGRRTARGRPARGDREAGAAGSHPLQARVGDALQGRVRAARSTTRGRRSSSPTSSTTTRSESMRSSCSRSSAVRSAIPDAPAHAARAGELASASATPAAERGDWRVATCSTLRRSIDTARALLEGEYRALARARRAGSGRHPQRAFPLSSSGAAAGSSRPSTPTRAYEITVQYGLEVPWTTCRSL